MHGLTFDYSRHLITLNEDLNRQENIFSQLKTRHSLLFLHVNIGDSSNWTSLSISIKKSTVTSISALERTRELEGKISKCNSDLQ